MVLLNFLWTANLTTSNTIAYSSSTNESAGTALSLVFVLDDLHGFSSIAGSPDACRLYGFV